MNCGFQHIGSCRNKRAGKREGGFVMLVGLILLVVVTLLSVSMFRSFGLQEKVAGNIRDKQRALESSQTALQYAEWWLLQSTPSTGETCTGPRTVDSNADASLVRVCTQPLANPNALASWTAANSPRTNYLPPGMTVNSEGGLNADGSDINYEAMPAFHIQYIGPSGDPAYLLYRVSALGYGGNDGSVAVVQSTFQNRITMVTDRGGR